MVTPNLYVIAGCNGSGKTTIANALLPNYFNCNEFVNADMMAAEIAPGNLASVAIKAGKMTLELVNDLLDKQMSFAIETTLSGNVHQRIIRKARERGYYVILLYVWVRSARISIARVRQRTRLGGHFVDIDDIKRRYQRGLTNLFKIYMDLCDYWVILDNMKPPQKIVAEGTGRLKFNVHNSNIWNRIKAVYHEYEAGS